MQAEAHSTTASDCPFDAIVVTARHEKQAQAYSQELAKRKVFKDVLTLGVADPRYERVGSGGGTMNALVAVFDALTKKAGGSDVDLDLIAKSKICIIHSGGDSQRSPSQSVCGKAWSSLNSINARGELLAPIDLLFDSLCRVFRNSPKGGVVVASCDVMLLLPDIEYDWSHAGITGLAIPMDLSNGPNRGVYKMCSTGTAVDRYIQKGTVEELKSAGELLLSFSIVKYLWLAVVC